MKVTLSKFGPIEKETEIVIKPLTVFIGPNNTGKTWVASIICSLFGKGGFFTFRDNHYFSEESKIEFNIIDEVYSDLKQKGSTVIDYNLIFQEYCDEYYRQLSYASKSWMASFLGTSPSQFEKSSIKIDISGHKTKFKDYIKALELSLKFPYGEITGILEYRKMKNDSKLNIFISENRKITELPEEEIKKSLFSQIFQPIHRFIYSDTYYLVAERTGIVSFINTFTLTSPKNLPRSKKNERIETQMPFPLSTLVDDILSLRNAKNVENLEIERSKTNFYKLSSILEESVMQGKLTHERDDSKLNEKWHFNFKEAKEIDLELPASSSTVKNITPLSYYLKYRADQNQLLLIDEPEMNLHPSAQVKLIEFITILINEGLNVIVTTHSPYLVDHLSNLIKAYDITKESDETKRNKIKNLFYLKNSDSFIDKEKVNILLFCNNTARSIIRDDGTIDWGSFSKTTNEILEIADNMED